MRTSVLLGFAMLCGMAIPGIGQTFDIKPGLWNITNTTQMSGLPPIPNLDQMTPEQRARVEAAMKNMAGTPHTNTVKSCVTKEGIQKAIADASSRKGDSCSPKLVNMSASKVQLHIACDQENGRMKSNGDMTIERVDSEHFKGTGAMKTGDSNGRSMDIKWSMSGSFVSSDCGNVKP